MAERLQSSVATIHRMEHGDAGVGIGTIAQALFVLGELGNLAELLDTAADEIGLSLMNQQLPRRIRRKRVKPDQGALRVNKRHSRQSRSRWAKVPVPSAR